jgi:hypothetical protein
MTHFVIRVTLSNLYQSGDPNVNKQVLKNLPCAKKENRALREKTQRSLFTFAVNLQAFFGRKKLTTAKQSFVVCYYLAHGIVEAACIRESLHVSVVD